MRTGFVGLVLIASLTVAIARDHKHPQPPQNPPTRPVPPTTPPPTTPPPTVTTTNTPPSQPVNTAPFGITILRNLRNVSLNK